MPKTIVIIGIGNYLMGDEGAGIHAVELLRSQKFVDDIEIIDGGTIGVALLHIMRGKKLVIIIDCADFNGKPGEIKVFDPANLKRDANPVIDLHATDLLSTLELAKSTQNYPDIIRIIGIQPENIGMTTSLSEKVTASLNSLRPAIDTIISSCIKE